MLECQITAADRNEVAEPREMQEMEYNNGRDIEV